MQCPQHKKALEKLAIEDIIKKCEMCGRVANLYCSSCKFVLCNQCDKDDRPRSTSTITQKVKAEYYSNNYVCSACKKDKIGNDDGLWHCN
jgi:hypothetical protein